MDGPFLLYGTERVYKQIISQRFLFENIRGENESCPVGWIPTGHFALRFVFTGELLDSCYNFICFTRA
jgi:hypothetical protein